MVDEAACMKCGSGAKANDGGGIKPTSRSFYKRELPRSLVDLSSHEGKERFERALQNGEADAFFSLVSSFQTQSHPSFCGLTTLSTVLNALHIDPERVWKHPWRWYSEALLECCLTLEYIEKHGITLDQLAMVARCEGCVTHVWRGLAVDDVRTLIRDSVHTTPPDASEKPELVVASYDRTALSQTGGGHFSPIAAYDQQSDSVLILDVARFKVSHHFPFAL